MIDNQQNDGVEPFPWLFIWLAAAIVAHIGATFLTHDSSLTPAHLIIDAVFGGFLTGFIWLIWAFKSKEALPLPLSERIEGAERFMSNTGATIQHGGNSAFYAPGRDLIQLPPFEAFKDKESYYATGLHEIGTVATVLLERSLDSCGITGAENLTLIAAEVSERLELLEERVRRGFGVTMDR